MAPSGDGAAHEDRIGNQGEGGKWMCNIDALRDKKDCLIYSIGSNNDFSWEEGVKARAPNCVIHVFDHTVVNASNKPHNVFFHRWGLSEVDSNRNPNLKSLSEISKALGHKDKRVDVFKIDCEGFYPYDIEKKKFVSEETGDIQLFLDLLWDMSGGEETVQEYLLKWIAFLFQNPEKKPKTALVFQSKEGSGKNEFWGLIGKLMGKATYLETSNALLCLY
ncbi:unnamed protein product [Bathycoccus prasinos]